MSDPEVTLAIGTNKGLFLARSEAGRSRFRVEGPLLKGWEASALTTLPDGSALLATTSHVYGASLHRSTDLRTWTPLERGPRFDQGGGRTLKRIWTLVAAGDRWFAGVDEAALFQSDDGGASWTLVEGLEGHPTRGKWCPGLGGLCLHHVLVDPADHERMWCGISAVGVFRSEDGGRTWAAKNRGVPVILEDEVHKDIGYCVHALVADPTDADRIWRQDHKGMYRTADGGDSWQRIEEGLPSPFGFPIARDRRTGSLYAVPLESDEFRMPGEGMLCVFTSRDGGDSWAALPSRGLPPSYHATLRHALAVDHGERCGVYFGTTAGQVHAHVEGDDHWVTLPEVLPRILFVRVC